MRAVQIQVGTKFLVRLIQLLYLLKLHYAVLATEVKEQEENNLNANAEELRQRRNAAAIADARIQDNNASEDDQCDI